ncbi:hypothetical protein NC651_004838 [Populus alba x Populus x berolinensis]|nr:hypothetical protein NC651_004838 [Populus alba x Populus x berolinensis]
MASIDYEPKLLAILSISFLLSCIFVSVAALDDSALLASEGKALLESGWWSDYSNLTSYRCNWTGIVCDRAGSITEISPPPEFLKVGNKFGKMNFTAPPIKLQRKVTKKEHHQYSKKDVPSIIIELMDHIPTLTLIVFSYGITPLPLPTRQSDSGGDFCCGSWRWRRSEGGNLTNLRYINLFSDQINGSISYERVNMENLKTLDLSSNNPVASKSMQWANFP